MRIVYKEHAESYISSYIDGYADALEDMRHWWQARRQQERDKQARRQYFLKQRLTGVFLLVFTVLAVIATGGDATIAIITVPLGLYLVFTKEMVIMNDFYWEMREGRGNDSRRLL
ncbi:MAG: hypothetical protein NC548_40690 [Lachnospiraceae bacterium]|nr:hypothetical protein [Lachnospiraceae bacterium]